ncbi:RnfABCDGE type electron transport complex subunit D [Parabacteroides sp. FAFU027]|uniref:RnfABCDGE type electron transport complex subunit D n=1 Tax=Parabacteroides sp. FAFU027 TaxID=2922715 RepID=UPI001FAFC13D|nr:RnfABCDGE type electron transport complex subunit D [Parabacteroides sp. FAFU027]
MTQPLIVSPSPHIHSGDSVAKNMHSVLIALVPAFCVAVYAFGLGAITVTATSVAACLLFEYLIQRYLLKGEKTISDGSAILTGVLLAFNLPSNLPLWIVVLGALFAIGVAKMPFGGLGNNLFNPALAGRVFLLISFPAQMTTWPIANAANRFSTVDVETGATHLAVLKGYLSTDSLHFLDLFYGKMGGSLGEISALALLAGFVFLLIRKIITWHIPVSIFASVALFAFLMGSDPVQHLFSGGLMLGAIFMATDYVTSPMTSKGMLIYGASIGLLTMLIRQYGAYPEGVSFAILLMNGVTPLLNTYCKPTRFGEVKHG